MKHRQLISLLIVIIVAAGVILVVLKSQEPQHQLRQDGKYTYVSGAVTAYDVTPSYSDGNIIFQIDNTPVDIGGGFRATTKVGSVYTPIHKGDLVQAKLIGTNGHLTVYDCSECYVKKQ